MHPRPSFVIPPLALALMLAGCFGGGGDADETSVTPTPGETDFPAANELLQLDVTAEPVDDTPCLEEPASVVAHVTAGGEPQGGALVEGRFHLGERVVTQNATTDGMGDALVGQVLEGVAAGEPVRVEVVAAIGEREAQTEVSLTPEAC